MDPRVAWANLFARVSPLSNTVEGAPVAWIETIDESRADGRLARIYDATKTRAGRVYNIIKVQSQNPAALQGMMQLYQAASLGESPLTRVQREMLAVVVSRTNDCHY